MKHDDDNMKSLIADLETDCPQRWEHALKVGREQWRERSSVGVLEVVGDYNGGLLPQNIVEQLVAMLEVDKTAQYVLLAHNANQQELAIEEYADFTVLLHPFAAPIIPADESVTGQEYTLHMSWCATCLKSDCNFKDCPGSLLAQQQQ